MSNNTRWADRVKSDLSSTPTKKLQAVGGGAALPPIAIYFQYSTPRENAPETAQELVKGAQINGTYEGNFTTKKFGTTYYKVQTDKGLVAIPASGQLKTLMGRVAQGAEVQIIYNGKEVIKKGNFAGKAAHSFQVQASDLVAAS